MRHVPTHAAPTPDDDPGGASVLGTAALVVVSILALAVVAGTTLVASGVVGVPEPQPRVAAPPEPASSRPSPGVSSPTPAPPPGTAPSGSARSSGPAAPSPPAVQSEPQAPRTATAAARTLWARTLVADWHRQRARAWSAVDEAALRALYASGARTGAVDVARLRRWEESGWRVAAQRTAVERVEVERVGRTRLRLRVRDRLARAEAVDDEGRARRLERPAPVRTSTWRMRREDGRWLLVSAT